MSDPVEAAKRLAARAAVDNHVKAGDAVGIGSGSTVVFAIERLAERSREEKLNVVCVPTSFQSSLLLSESGLVVSDLTRHPALAVCIDGADEIDPKLALIKGGGGCHTQEKAVAAASRELIIVADYRKVSPRLGTAWTKGVPVEVLPFTHKPILQKLAALGGKPALRSGSGKAGPVVTDNGNFIVDVEFGPMTTERAAELHGQIKALTGVVETGLFVGMASKAYIGEKDGSVRTLIPQL